ncbi:MAG: AraC family transcriptional regulator [Planctomycetes bacterium]|nr:AraC family transcriptional regulator [Planctomycetota bacterium]
MNTDSSGQHSSSVHNIFFHNESKTDIDSLFHIVYMGVSFEKVDESYFFETHPHRNHELIFVTDGTYRCALNNEEEEVSVKPGQLVIVEPGNIHRDICVPPLSFYALWFDVLKVNAKGQPEKLSMLRRGLSGAQHVFDIDSNIFTPRLDSILQKIKENSRFSPVLQQVMGKEIFWRLAECLPIDRLNPALTDSTLGSQLKYRLNSLFETNRSSNLSVSDMAGLLNMSESSLTQKCRKVLGLSPARAFLKFRLNRAMHLLRRTNLSIKEIGSISGFNDASHFVNTFRKETGLTPGQYKSENSPESKSSE